MFRYFLFKQNSKVKLNLKTSSIYRGFLFISSIYRDFLKHYLREVSFRENKKLKINKQKNEINNKTNKTKRIKINLKSNS